MENWARLNPLTILVYQEITKASKDLPSQLLGMSSNSESSENNPSMLHGHAAYVAGAAKVSN